MSRIRFAEEKFICDNKDCDAFEKELKIFVWSDRKLNPNCEVCGKEITVSKCFTENKAPAHLKFNSMSAGEKRAMLKQRSYKDNRKPSNVEKRKWMFDNDIN